VQAEAGNVALYRVRASVDNCTVGSRTNVHVPPGEHCYYDPANPPTAVVVPSDQTFMFERTNEIPYIATTAELGGRTYVADTGSMQYAQKLGSSPNAPGSSSTASAMTASGRAGTRSVGTTLRPSAGPP